MGLGSGAFKFSYAMLMLLQSSFTRPDLSSIAVSLVVGVGFVLVADKLIDT